MTTRICLHKLHVYIQRQWSWPVFYLWLTGNETSTPVLGLIKVLLAAGLDSGRWVASPIDETELSLTPHNTKRLVFKFRSWGVGSVGAISLLTLQLRKRWVHYVCVCNIGNQHNTASAWSLQGIKRHLYRDWMDHSPCQSTDSLPALDHSRLVIS